MKRGRPRSNKVRDKQIAAAVARGETFEAVGNHYGITRERVRQIAAELRVDANQGAQFNPVDIGGHDRGDPSRC
jgi:uncharacterized protein (DUF433 family)